MSLLRKEDLIKTLERGCRPPDQFVIGTEHEKFVFVGNKPLPYDGIKTLLEGLQKFGWQPVCEDGKLISLSQNGAYITLEPGGQLELSGGKLASIHETCREMRQHLQQIRTLEKDLDFRLMGIGFAPEWRREEMPVMPKARYEIMRAYMPKKGNLGLDMMLRTCTVQVNLDFSSEQDMVRKMRVGLALQPIVTALFANSPFKNGTPNGWQSFRAQIWTDTDPDRTGGLPFAFEDGFGFERYVDYALDVPMYFIRRDGRYIDMTTHSFRQFLDTGKAKQQDWDDHLTTLFPDVRLKQFLEMRGADAGPLCYLCALPALWTGLFYSSSSLDAAYEIIKDWTAEERDDLRRSVPKTGLKTKFRTQSLQEIVLQLLNISQLGLEERHINDEKGRDECHFLDPLWTIAKSGKTESDRLLNLYHTVWNHSITPIYQEIAY